MKQKLLILFVALAVTSALLASIVITYQATEKLTETTETWESGLHTNAFNVSISSHTFSNGTGTITFSGEVTSIGKSAFSGCSGLTSITIPSSVTSIGEYAFAGCSGLTSINVDASNKSYASIDGVLFNYAKDTLILYPIGNTRASYIIPNSVTSIGDHAFYDCSSLTSITIPNSVTSIDYYAFYGCSSLTSVTCEAATPPHVSDCFYGVDKSIPLYVPANSITAYQNAYEWNDFTNILPITGTPVSVTDVTIQDKPNEPGTIVISWPAVSNANNYTIEIRKAGQLICTLVFNAQGQLLSINFAAPARGERQAEMATETTNGWAYTITGLTPGTQYTYNVIAKNAASQTINTKTGHFTTSSITALEETLSGNDQGGATKFVKDGILYILRDGKIYNAQGQEAYRQSR